jgi:hypothetical protein
MSTDLLIMLETSLFEGGGGCLSSFTEAHRPGTALARLGSVIHHQTTGITGLT